MQSNHVQSGEKKGGRAAAFPALRGAKSRAERRGVLPGRWAGGSSTQAGSEASGARHGCKGEIPNNAQHTGKQRAHSVAAHHGRRSLNASQNSRGPSGLILCSLYLDWSTQVGKGELVELPLAACFCINLGHHERIDHFVSADHSYKVHIVQ